MKLAIMQPYFFPYIGYFQLINAVDKFIFYDDVNFIKQGWIHRNNILVNGKKYLFTIPVKNKSSFEKINKTEINPNEYKRFVKKFLKTLYSSYKKAPFFGEIYPIIEKILDSEQKSISSLAKQSIKSVINYLEMEKIFVNTSEIYNNSNLKGQQRVLDICMKENAKIYINPIGGKQLYNKQDFKIKGIDLFFIKTNQIFYKQNSDTFIPNLSIIDVLMFNPKNKIRELLNQYELI